MKPPTPYRTASVPRAAADAPSPGTRPTFFDYFLLLFGCALSLYLVELVGYHARESEQVAEHLPVAVQRLLPRLLFLQVGVLLFWPLFYATQRVVGRPPALSPVEWLWGVAWLAAVALVAWVVWQSLPDAPEAIKTRAVKGMVFVGYAVTVLALAAIALLIGLLSLFSRERQPWTHACGLVLLLWPSLPLAALLLLKLQVE